MTLTVAAVRFEGWAGEVVGFSLIFILRTARRRVVVMSRRRRRCLTLKRRSFRTLGTTFAPAHFAPGMPHAPVYYRYTEMFVSSITS